MTKKFCDRCGAEIAPDYPWQQTIFPSYVIQKMDTNIHNGLIPVDLCPNCKREFTNWLENKPEDKE